MSVLTYKGNKFFLDGEEFTIISGAMHYFRIPREYWRDRLLKLKECGFNTVETYTCWNLHEPQEGKFDFSGMLDLETYIDIAKELGLNVILRPGPYICAEWEMGGLPAWLLNYKDMTVRCNNELFISKVERYYNELLRRIVPKLSTNGGNIIMMQIENEYGSYGDDHEYMQKIADIYKKNGVDCLLFTSDGASYSMLQGGTLPEYPCVANFGSHPEENFKVLNDFRPDQPLMCGEYWVGWFDHWYEEHHVRSTEDIAADTEEMFACGASFNFYMFHGGTNFGFTNGANHPGTYQPTVTSYDYCAPLSEAGDRTPMYYGLRAEIEKEFGKLPPMTATETPKKNYGCITLDEQADLFENLDRIAKPIHAPAPQYMEQLGQNFGYLLYRTEIKGPRDPKPLCFNEVHDRAQVFVNGEFKHVYERWAPTPEEESITLPLAIGENAQMDILVENMGRVNYGPKLRDRKGVSGVRFGQFYHFGWDMYCLPMEDFSGLVFQKSDALPQNRPTFYRGTLTVEGTPADTFVRPRGFKKGFIVVNGHNLGRYFNLAGPQKTLYLPAPFLKSGENEVLVFDSDGTDSLVLEFSDTPDLG